jgi:hypothetical protein
VFWPNHVATAVENSIPGGHMSGFFSIPVVYIDNRGQFSIPYFIYFSRILDRGGTTWTGYFKCREAKLDFSERDECEPVLLGLSMAGNLVKPLLSLHGTEWRDRGYGLRSGGGGAFFTKPNLVSYPSSPLKEEKIRKTCCLYFIMYGKGGSTAVVKKSAKIQLWQKSAKIEENK